MRKLRKVSLEGINYLSNEEKRTLIGGDVDSCVTFKTTPPPSPPPYTVSIEPGPTITGTISFNF